MTEGTHAVDVLREAAALNRADTLLNGSLLEFPNYGQLVMTGDLHGHRRNFEKLRRYCDLANAGARHVVLHEIIHEDVSGSDAHDQSHEVLLEAARWKCQYPEQVHFLQSNHELAQIHGHEITKNGRVVTMAFEQGVSAAYGSGAGDVLEAMYDFIRSLPLAGRTENRIFLAHSLPGPREVAGFDESVLRRVPTIDDLGDHGSVHRLVWGRYHQADTLEALAALLNADFFVCGHQPQETGYAVLHGRMIILASDHNHGVFLPIDLSKPVTVDVLEGRIRPLAGIA